MIFHLSCSPPPFTRVLENLRWLQRNKTDLHPQVFVFTPVVLCCRNIWKIGTENHHLDKLMDRCVNVITIMIIK